MNPQAQKLAHELFEARRDLSHAGRTLHDQVGALLSAAGLHLQLLGLDHPEAAPGAAGIALLLEGAMEEIRGLSRRLDGSPAATLGLANALAQLAARRAESFHGTIRIAYAATAKLPPDIAVVLYEAVESAVDFFCRDRSATRIMISVRGAARLTARVSSNGRARWSRARLAEEAFRSRPAGLELDVISDKDTLVSSKHGTIVCIKYVGRPISG